MNIEHRTSNGTSNAALRFNKLKIGFNFIKHDIAREMEGGIVRPSCGNFFTIKWSGFAQLIALMVFAMKWNCPRAFCPGQFENGKLLNIKMVKVWEWIRRIVESLKRDKDPQITPIFAD